MERERIMHSVINSI